MFPNLTPFTLFTEQIRNKAPIYFFIKINYRRTCFDSEMTTILSDFAALFIFLTGNGPRPAANLPIPEIKMEEQVRGGCACVCLSTEQRFRSTHGFILKHVQSYSQVPPLSLRWYGTCPCPLQCLSENVIYTAI